MRSSLYSPWVWSSSCCIEPSGTPAHLMLFSIRSGRTGKSILQRWVPKVVYLMLSKEARWFLLFDMNTKWREEVKIVSFIYRATSRQRRGRKCLRKPKEIAYEHDPFLFHMGWIRVSVLRPSSTNLVLPTRFTTSNRSNTEFIVQ